MSDATPPKKPTSFTKPPEKRDWRMVAVFCVLLAIGVGAIVWMVQSAPRQKQLICDSGPGALNAFGRCHTAD